MPPRSDGFSGGEGQGQKRQRSSRRVRGRGRRFRARLAILARRIGVRAVAQRYPVELRHHSGPDRRHGACSPQPICATAICAPIPAIPPRCCGRFSARATSSAPSRSRATSPSTPRCAPIHARSVTGCTRCLDLCPTGAITPAGDHVAIDANICAGCGQCAAACPTGAASYALPPEDALMRRLRAMLIAYREAGGERAIVLVHDDPHGVPLIDALARFGDGLPAHVLPLAVNEITQIGLESVVAAFAYGASAMRLPASGAAAPRRRRPDANHRAGRSDPHRAWTSASSRIATIETDDPDHLIAALRAIPSMPPAPRPASFRPVGRKRDVLRFALSELHRAAPAPVDIVALPEGAPFGAVEIDVGGCTLCLSCVSACPTGRIARRSGTANAAFCRRRLRAMRTVPGDLPREASSR